jgi:hypothetical protein
LQLGIVPVQYISVRPLTSLKGRACLAAVRRRENNDEPGQHSFWCRLSIYASSRKAVPGDDFGFEQFASDDMIGDKLTEAAFSEVEVTGGRALERQQEDGASRT